MDPTTITHIAEARAMPPRSHLRAPWRFGHNTATGCLSEIVLVTKGGQMEVKRHRAYFRPHPISNARATSTASCCRFLGMKPVIGQRHKLYCVGGRTAVGINAPAPEHADSAFEQNRVGLHHLCFAPASAPTLMNCTASCVRSA